MIAHELNSLMDAFDDVDKEGNLEFFVGKRFKINKEHKTLESLSRRIVDAVLINHALVRIGLGTPKSYVKYLLCDIVQTGSSEWILKINFCKLMLLPGIAPAQELAELRTLFDLFIQVIEEDTSRKAFLSIANQKDRNRKVFGKVFCNYFDAPGAVSGTLPVTAQARVDALVAGSPLIQEYLRQVALRLGKLGPHSWVSITEDQLYPPYEGPWKRASYIKKYSSK
jgi:hypothetical protein